MLRLQKKPRSPQANNSSFSLNKEAVHFNRLFVEGVIARMTKDDDKAQSAFIAARAEQEKIVQVQPNYGPPLVVLGLIDAALGRERRSTARRPARDSAFACGKRFNQWTAHDRVFSDDRCLDRRQ